MSFSPRGALVATLLLLGACACRLPPTSPSPPDPDLSTYQAPVAKSLREARAAVESAPGSADAWGRYGEVLFAHNYFDDALVCFRQAHRLGAGDFRWPYLAGHTLQLSDVQEAVEMFERARALEPSYVAAHVRLGRSLLSSARPADARKAFEQALELRPDDSHALLGLALVELDHGDTAAARGHLERAAQARPDHREVHATLATVYRRLGLEQQAREAAARGALHADETPMLDPVLDEVLARGSSAVHLALRGHELLEQGRLDEAIELLRVAFRERPDYFDVRVDLGRALVLSGEESEGAQLLREAEDQAPDLVDADELLDELRASRQP